MRLAITVLGLAAAVAIAAPAPRSLPLPPVPPAVPPAEQAAPTPDRDARAPWAPSEPGVRIVPQDFRIRRFNNQGLGYAPGSQFETSEDKRPIQTPGLSVQVPLK